MEFEEVKNRAEALFILQKEYEEAKHFSNDLWHEFKRKEAELGEILRGYELNKLVVSNGTFAVVEEENYEVQDYEAFRKHLYKTGNDSLLTVHANRLKSFLKIEYENGREIEGVKRADLRTTYRLYKN